MRVLVVGGAICCAVLAGPGTSEAASDAESALWRPFLIEMAQDGHVKISTWWKIGSERAWQDQSKSNPSFAKAKLLGYFVSPAHGPEPIAAFCTKSCNGAEPGRTYSGLANSECVKDCDAGSPIEAYFAENGMNFKKTAKQLQEEAATDREYAKRVKPKAISF